MATVLKLDEIKSLVDIPQLVQDIETGFVLYSEGKAVIPPVGELQFKEPPGETHIKYGYLLDDDYYVIKMAADDREGVKTPNRQVFYGEQTRSLRISNT